MTVIKVEGLGQKHALLSVIAGDGWFRKYSLTMQELIDLEGACAAARLNLEGGDKPKQEQKAERKLSGLERWMKAAGIDLDALQQDLKNDSEIAKARKKTKSVSEFFDQFGIDYAKEMTDLLSSLIPSLSPVQSVNGHVGHVAIQGTQYELTTKVTTTANNDTDWRYTPVTPDEIGTLVDRTTQNVSQGKPRSAARIARRVLEECVEMCLEAGANAQEIMGSVSDSLHNQALKLSAESAVTVFPSQIESSFSHSPLIKEIADVKLVLADLLYVSRISTQDVSKQERAKFNRLCDPSAQFATDGHTFYLRKPHVKAGTPST